MCGFWSEYSLKEISSKADFDYYQKDLKRRGPDEQRIIKEGSFIAGFSRLSIRDLSSAGSQPMLSGSGDSIIVFNGEIYNIDELKKIFLPKNFIAKGHSDTEILLESFERNSFSEVLKKADGIFAITYYNKKSGQLLIARDHLGIKPIYYGISNHGLFVSSHYHHITTHPWFRNGKIIASSLENYFKYGFIQEGEGLLENTFFMPQGHYILYNKYGDFELIKYHQPWGISKDQPLINVLKKAVREQLVSDVPIGSFLSGGIDSSIVTSIAVKESPKIKAFTVGVDQIEMDETVEASKTAKALDIDHIISKTEAKDANRLLDEYVESMAEPLSDFSSLVTLEVCRQAKKHMTVALSGDGGDELFFGYARFQRINKAHLFFKKNILSRFIIILKSKFNGKSTPFGWLQYPDLGRYYLKAQGIPGHEQILKKLLVSTRVNILPFSIRSYRLNPETEDEAGELCRNIEKHIHMQRVLLKMDRASMYHSLEVRTPLLSKMVEGASLNFSLKSCLNSDNLGKIPLREILSQLINITELAKAPKRGFTLPMDQWLRKDLKERVKNRIFNIPEPLSPFLNKDTITTLWQEHMNGKDHSWMIWSLFSLFSWVDQKMFK